MKHKTLSAFPYYGGKARMASFISGMLDYSVDTYIEPFGGACRVLLNKPRHKCEIYNDSSFGLCAFFKLMSTKVKSDELINQLYKTEYSQECFDAAIKYRDSVDDNVIKQTYKEVMQYQRELLVKYNIISKYDDYNTYMRALKSLDKSFVSMLTHNELRHVKLLYSNYSLSNSAMEETGHLDLPEDWVELDIEELVYDVDLAVATFVIYSQSRDAMGTTWTADKYKTQEAYYKKIDNLYEIADRLEGVEVPGPSGAIAFLLDNSYLHDSNVMMYLDPSYLKPEDEERLKLKRDKSIGKIVKPQNLGTVYKQSFDYDDHELLLEVIKDANCKLLVSNYDVDLYNEYLCPPRWKRVEFETKTSVGGKKDNRRTEVLWYNY